MIDATPLSTEDVVQHCRALSQAIIESNSLVVKESLNFVLAEKIEWLSLNLDENFILEKT
ncbi:hypothetical protein SC206_18415 [Rouxiella sp. T17]|uniref:hypothetical protein n=1 Tax=Rouxiella sp. T17 TaxID=3085684 RepID=UPI002FCC2164